MALDAILDTRFYFSYYNPEDENVAKWTKRIVQLASRGAIRLGSSIVTITELYRTMEKLIGVKTVEMRIKSARAFNIIFIPVTEEVAKKAGLISLKARVPIADAIIAATALIYAKGIVITDDEHFELIKGVKLKWLTEI